MSFNVQPPSRSHKAITNSTLVVGFFVIGIYGNAPKPPPDKDNDSINVGFFQNRNNPYFLLTTPFGDLKGY